MASISRTLDTRIVVDVRNRGVLEGYFPSRRVVVVEMRRFAHARRRTHHRHSFVVPQPPAALPTLDDGDETPTKLLIKESVQNRVDARVGGTQPLRDGCSNGQNLLLPALYVSTELNPGENHVQR